jgi:hypothetical protein
MERSPQLTIELVWEDPDIEELCIVADNGQYSGAASVYFARGDAGVLANALRGFPKTTSQREEFSGGSEDGEVSYAQLVFFCMDGAGHVAVEVTLSECLFHHGRRTNRNRAQLLLRFEPLALDTFCRELDAIARRTTKRAVLPGIAA